MSRWPLLIFWSVGQRSRSKVQLIIYMLGKGGLVFYKHLYLGRLEKKTWWPTWPIRKKGESKISTRQNFDHQSPRWRVRHNRYMFVCQFFLSSPTQFWLKSWSLRCFNALVVLSISYIQRIHKWDNNVLHVDRVVFSDSLGKVMWFSKVLSCGGTCMAKVKDLSKW